MLADRHGRRIGYLRLSLTAACPMRCRYCRPAVLHESGKRPSLSAGEIEAIVRHLVTHWGLRKVRLTGGEPTARRDLLEIIARLARIEGLRDLAMTTNGLTLPRSAAALRRAGLRRVNISLDSLRPDTFHRVTGVRGLERVIAGIDAAIKAGLTPVRLNTVVLAGENDDELTELVEFAAARGLEIRFIELMPMGPLAEEWSARYVPASVLRARLEPAVEEWQPLPQGHDSASRYRVRLAGGREAIVGFITPMSCAFCAACNRLRLTAAGDVYPCLMDQPRGNVLAAATPRLDADRFDRVLRDALDGKAPVHPAAGCTPMTVLGG